MPRRPAPRPRLEPLEDRTTPTAGDLDPTFGSGGRVLPDVGGFGALHGVAAQPDGKLLVAGQTNGFQAGDMAVARLTATGQPDASFGNGGVYALDLGGSEYASGVLPLPDGSVLVSAYTDTPGGSVVLVRLTATGQPDPTFGTGGVARVGFGGSYEYGEVAGVMADGRIVVAGASDFDFAAARLTSTGQLDATFGVGGRVVDTAGPDRDSRGLVLQPDGKVVVVGYTRAGPAPLVAAVRFTAGGQLDPTFGTGGRVGFGLGSFDFTTGVALQPNGGLVVAGFTDEPQARNFAALRLTPAGQLDPAFGTGGLAVIDFGYEDTPSGVFVQPNGSIVLTGNVNTAPVYSFAAARLTPAGQPDPTFGTNGRVVHPFSDFDQAHGGGLQADGKVFVVGSYLNPAGGSYPMAVRLTADPAPNTPPTVSDVANQTVPAGGSTGALAVTLSDAETAAASLTLTATSSNTTLVPPGAISLGGAGGARTVTVTPAAGRSGTTTITLTVTDGGGLTATDTFTVTVPPPPPPNTPPQISDVPNQTVAAGGSTGPLSFTVADAETPAAALAVTASSSNPALVPAGAIVLGGSAGSRTVTVAPAAGQYGTATITLTVSDGLLAAADTFTIDVPLPPPPPLPPPLPSAPITVAETGYDTPANAMSVAAGDFNNDGHPDAVVGSSGGVSVFLNDGTGVTGNKTDYATGSAFPRFVRVTDLTGDGKPDIIAANDTGHTLSIFRGVGDGTFQAAVQVPTGGANLQGFAVADFTGDGKPDVAVVTDTGVALLTNVGGVGILGAPAGVSAVGGFSLDTADFNHDAKADLVVADTTGGRLVVYPGTGNGAFGAGLTVATGVGSGPFGVIARRADGGLLDWNGDGHADLAAGCADAGMVEVFLGNGAGAFTLSAVLNPGFPRAGRLAAADFDADGFLDLVAQASGGGTPTTQPVFVGDGAGGFTGVAQVNTAGDTDVTAADVNGDGRPDILGSLSFSPGFLGVSINTTPVAASFQVSGPATAQIGVPFAVTVTAKAAGGATFAGYKGAAHFTSTDGSAVLPPDVRFTPDDNGVKTVMVTLHTAGAWSVAVRDKVLTGSAGAAAVRINSNPTAAADSLTVAEDAAATPVPVLANDSTAPDTGETLTVTAVAQPAHGGVVLSGGVVTYAPAANYNGADSFTYTVSDGNGGTATATVAVTVTGANDPPAANPDTLTVAEDAAATAVPVLGNDSFAPDAGEMLTVTAVAQPLHGVVTLVGGVVRYAPALNYNGADSFTYTLSDGNGGTATGTVSVTVTAVNDPPGAVADAFTVAEDGPATDVPVLANDTSPEPGETLTVVSVTPPLHGVVTLVGGVVRYAPAANYNGADVFTYTVSDGNSPAIGSVAVTVTPVNDPPTAAADAYLIAAGAPTTLPVLMNDTTAPDAGETLAVVAITQPSAGGSVAIAPGGSGVMFTPAPGFRGTTTFTYTVGEGQPGSTSTTVVTVEVRAASLVGPVLVTGPGGGAGSLFTPSGGKYGSATGATLVPGFGGVIHPALGDINADGVLDQVVGTGPGASLVRVLDGKTGAELASLQPFPGYAGGVFVAVGDLNGDGTPDIAVTPDAEDAFSGPVDTQLPVRIYSGAGFGLLAAFDGLASLSGASGQAAGTKLGGRPSIADIDGDGSPDLLIAAGNGGGPRVTIWKGTSFAGAAGGKPTQGPLANVFVFEPTQRGGAFITAGDVTGDGKAEIIVGGGPGGGPRVRVVDAAKFLAVPNLDNVDLDNPANLASGLVRNNFFAGADTLRGGLRLVVRDVDGDGKADVVTGSGAGERSSVRVYSATALAAVAGTSNEPANPQVFDPFGAVLPGGVFVG